MHLPSVQERLFYERLCFKLGFDRHAQRVSRAVYWFRARVDNQLPNDGYSWCIWRGGAWNAIQRFCRNIHGSADCLNGWTIHFLHRVGWRLHPLRWWDAGRRQQGAAWHPDSLQQHHSIWRRVRCLHRLFSGTRQQCYAGHLLGTRYIQQHGIHGFEYFPTIVMHRLRGRDILQSQRCDRPILSISWLPKKM